MASETGRSRAFHQTVATEKSEAEKQWDQNKD